jgi:hypothetical protein
LSHQLQDKPSNAKPIDEVLEREQAKAAEYASQPDRFTLIAFDLEIRVEQDNHLVLYDHGEWSCTCTFFEEWETCSHITATALLFKDSLVF